MSYIGDLPNVNLSIVNLLMSEDINRALNSDISSLLRNIFSVELGKLEIEVVKLSKNSTPYIFYIGHQQCALEISIPHRKLPVNSLSQLDPKVQSPVAIDTLIEEHLALQLSQVLKKLFFKDEIVIFQGQGAEDSFSELDCISIKCTTSRDGIELISRFNLYMPAHLTVSEDLGASVKNPILLNLSSEDLNREIKFDIFLGVLLIPPVSLVDMLVSGNVIDLPKELTPKQSIISIEDSIWFSGSMMNSASGNVFMFKEKREEDFFTHVMGFSSVFLRLYSGSISTSEVGMKFPYLSLNSKWIGEIEMLIGGEFVSRGVLEYGDEGLIVKVS